MSSRKWECMCGYSSNHRQGLHQHRKTCKSSSGGETEQLKSHVASLEKQLEETKRDAREQLAAKDRQIEQLIKKPRTINNNTTHNKIVVEQHINAFGNESIEHISQQQIQALLADTVNAVPQFIKLKHRKAPGGVNQNIRIPNKNKAIYQVVVDGGGDKEWENKSKGEVLEKLYDDSSGQLEAEADEETTVGSMFLSHQDKVKLSESGQDGGRLYKDQLDKIHNIL